MTTIEIAAAAIESASESAALRKVEKCIKKNVNNG